MADHSTTGSVSVFGLKQLGGSHADVSAPVIANDAGEPYIYHRLHCAGVDKPVVETTAQLADGAGESAGAEFIAAGQ
jgi:hypothetical protein